MRRFFILTLAVFFLLVACNDIKKPDDANFTKAINQYLAKHGEVCVSIGQTFPIDVTESEQNSQYGIAPQMAALEQAGLVHEQYDGGCSRNAGCTARPNSTATCETI